MRVRDSIHLVAWTLGALLLAMPAATAQGFTSCEPLEDKDGAAWTELHVVDIDGSDRAFVSGHVNLSRIAWAPDGRGITFLDEQGFDQIIYEEEQRARSL